MPKLTKQEVNAIAGKLHRDLEEKVRLERLRALHEYIPSPTYTEVESILDEISDINRQIEELKNKKTDLGKKVNGIVDKVGISRRYWNDWDCDNARDWLNDIISIETKVPTVPSIEELKDDITIAAIDSDFNVDDYLKAQLEKW